MKLSRATIHHFNKEEINISTKKARNIFVLLSYSDFYRKMHNKEIKIMIQRGYKLPPLGMISPKP
jgi:hypothetical protein